MYGILEIGQERSLQCAWMMDERRYLRNERGGGREGIGNRPKSKIYSLLLLYSL